ncbi:hypothetical protein [Flavobacterium caeni]|uniref:Uncharacterized protein n=1 Tax=Flavobacterium caeni TaxID=490189 RepID=A0A1G5EF27_9FLAO|nr:hypothetical protein [Flavobacterium caeni]SCY25589.1 hypothetical protein SAMN02927903_01038 [Flavobacterium caeni]
MGKQFEIITTLKSYQDRYKSRLENHLAEYEDYDEEHFLDSEIKYFNHCYQSVCISYENYMGIDESEYPSASVYAYTLYKPYSGFKPIQEIYELVLDDECEGTDGFDLDKAEKLQLSFKKIISHLEDLRFNLIAFGTTESAPKNPYPDIFTSYQAYLVFKDFTENITDYYLDFSFIFHKMKSTSEKLIHNRVKHKEFMEWLRVEKFISISTYEDFDIKASFSTKADRGMRPTRYYTIKNRHFPSDSD